eukprot:1442433-Rhodomonas_salina.2
MMMMMMMMPCLGVIVMLESRSASGVPVTVNVMKAAALSPRQDWEISGREEAEPASERLLRPRRQRQTTLRLSSFEGEPRQQGEA